METEMAAIFAWYAANPFVEQVCDSPDVYIYSLRSWHFSQAAIKQTCTMRTTATRYACA
jgi:hypothetical protein